MGIIKIDAMGDVCPMPVVKAKKAWEKAAAGEILEVHVDNEIAVENLRRMTQNLGGGFAMEKQNETHFTVRIEPDAAGGPADHVAAETPGPVSGAAGRSGLLVVIRSAGMGTGSDELGKILMKGYLYALSQMEELPEKILFYNGGVTLTTEGSDSLEDLKAMEARGVQIRSCGTCLDYYHLKDQLLVGEVTNMYDIAEAMAGAAGMISP